MRFFFQFLFLTVTVVTSTVMATPKKKLKVAYSVYPPYVYSNKALPEKPKGVIVDYWEKELGHSANIEIQWIGPLSYLRAKKMTLTGEADALYLIPTSVADNESFLYSKKIKFTTRQGIVVLKTDPMSSLNSPEDLRGRSIGKFAGGHMPGFLKNSEAQIVDILADDPIVRGLKMLLDKRIWGFYLVSTEAALFALEKMNSSDQVKVIDVPGENITVVCTLGFSPKIEKDILKRIYTAAEKKDSDTIFKGLLKGAYE